MKTASGTPRDSFENGGYRFPQAEENKASVPGTRNDHVSLSKSCFRFFEVAAGCPRAVSAKKKEQICTRHKSVIHRRGQATTQVAVRLRNKVRRARAKPLQPCAHLDFSINWRKVNGDAPARRNLRQLMFDECTIDSGRTFDSD